jgi:hypothetical protein
MTGEEKIQCLEFIQEQAIRQVQGNQERLKLIGTHDILVYAADVNLASKNTNTIKNTEAFLLGSKEAGPEINAQKTKYMFMSHQRNLGKNHDIKTGNKSFQNVANFKCPVTTLTNQNCLQEKNYKHIKFQEGLPSFCSVSSVFPFAI